MYTVSNEVLLNEAASIVARYDNMSVDFVFARYNTNQILNRCRRINREKEKSMDTIRSEWW